jgi:polysaccharide biosynthesis protein PslJ
VNGLAQGTSAIARWRTTPGSWVAVATAAVAAVAPLVLLQLPLIIVLLVLVAATGCVILLAVPIRWLPSAVLLAFALLPVTVLPGNRITASFSPVLVATAVWTIRCHNQPQLRPWPRTVCIFLSLWLAASTLASIAWEASALWAMNFLVLVIAVCWLASKTRPDAMRLLERTWMATAAILGALAVFEHQLGHNPIPYLANHYTLTQQYWSVYRVTTTLGTPLVNGTFFAAAAAIAWARMVIRPSLFTAASFLGAGAGLVFSYTRSALLGAGVAFLVLTIVRLSRRGGDFGLKFVAAVVIALSCIGGYTAIQVRAQSAEANSSATLRGQAVRAAAIIAADHHYIGSGPGTSHRAQLATGTAVPFYSQRSGIENSYLQIFVSIGVPGVAAVCLLIAVTIGSGLRQRAYTGVGALIAVAVSAGGYSMAESAVPALALIGLAMLLCVDDRRSSEPGRPQSGFRNASLSHSGGVRS